MNVRAHRFLAKSRVDGPGERAVLFAQGCPIRCAGCAVPWTWEADEGFDMDAYEIIRLVLEGPAVEGITFLGGEPFAQAAPLACIGRELKKNGLGVVTFTGYTLEKLQADGHPAALELLDVTDLLIDGPYDKELADTSRPWVGSSNQRYVFLTDRYKHIRKDLLKIPNRLEVRILPNGMVSVNGLVATDDLKEFVSALIN